MNEMKSSNMDNECKSMHSHIGDNVIRNNISKNQDCVQENPNIFPGSYAAGREFLDGFSMSTNSLQTSVGIRSVIESSSVKTTPGTSAVGKVLLNEDINMSPVFQTSLSSQDITNLDEKEKLKERLQTPQLSPSSKGFKESNHIPIGDLFQTTLPETHDITWKEGDHVTPVMKMTGAELPNKIQAEHLCDTDLLDDIPIATLFTGAASSRNKKSVDNEKHSSTLLKCEAPKEAALLSPLHGNSLAEMADDIQISDEEILLLNPKRKRRLAKFENPVPSHFCHVCLNGKENVRKAVCSNNKHGTCKKVICENCFKNYDLGDFGNALKTKDGDWNCSHCTENCPENAQCAKYKRSNEKRRLARLKYSMNNAEKRENTEGEDRKDVKEVTDAEKKSMLKRGNRKVRIFSPAIASSSKTMDICNPIDEMNTIAVENMKKDFVFIIMHEWSIPEGRVAVHYPQVNRNEMQTAVERKYPEINDMVIHTAAKDTHQKVTSEWGFLGMNEYNLRNAVEGNYPEDSGIRMQDVLERIHPEGNLIAMEPMSANITDFNNPAVENDVPYNAVMNNTFMGTDVMNTTGVNNSGMDNDVLYNGIMNNTYMGIDGIDSGGVTNSVMDNDFTWNDGMNNSYMDTDVMDTDSMDTDDKESANMNNAVDLHDGAEQYEMDNYEKGLTDQLNNIIAKLRGEEDKFNRSWNGFLAFVHVYHVMLCAAFVEG